MGFATDTLKEILNQSDITRADYAQACGMHVTNLYDILNGRVPISSRNIDKLLTALHSPPEKQRLLIAYLQDAIPLDMEGQITITAAQSSKTQGRAGDDSTRLIIQKLQALSPETRTQLLHLATHIQRDDELRTAFSSLMHYVLQQNTPPPPATIQNHSAASFTNNLRSALRPKNHPKTATHPHPISPRPKT